MQTSAFLKLSLFGILSAASLCTGVLAQEVKQDVSGAGQVAVEAKPTIKLLRVESDASAPASISADLASATFGSLSLTVQVDSLYCRTGGVQCTGAGLTTVAPADNNRNPVRLGLQVLDGLTPVTTLTDADVSVINSFVPAGGAAVSQLACASCFQNAGNGMYAIFVNPAAGQTWKPGSYFVQIVVVVGARTHRALAQIEIPF